MQNSKAYELWEAAQKDPSILKKLDQHLKELENKSK